MIVVLCPTRGRPESASRLAESFRDTAVLIGTELVLVVDDDDPSLPAYRDLRWVRRPGARSSGPIWPPDPVRLVTVVGGSLTAATNQAAALVWDDDCIIGHVGDDHAFRTIGWDRCISETLVEPGIAYGDDLLQGPALPTAVFMSSVIPRTLAWYALPGTRHMKIDTTWKELGERLGRLHYLPDVVIEHLHPAAGKAPEDAGYEAARASRDRDKAVYARWLRRRAAQDIRRVQRAIA